MPIDDLLKGTHKPTRELWPWVYWALKEQGDISDNKPKSALAKRLSDGGGPTIPPKEMWDKCRAFETKELIIQTDSEIGLSDLAHTVPPTNPYEKVRRDAERLTLPPRSGRVGSESDVQEEARVDQSLDQNVPPVTATPDSNVFDIVDQSDGTTITNVRVEPSFAPDLVESALNADSASIETRLVAISRLADSILIEGIPVPERDRDEILSRLSKATEYNQRLQRERDSLQTTIKALEARIRALTSVNDRLERNVEAMIKQDRVDDRAFKELRRIQSEAPRQRM